ncbi:hypothetical protein ACSV9I_04485 [Rhizobium sp. G187]|uniref:hypothetical protein n=1 Tax=Rhizobium sp. G187 TaxID=3451352 RepID=UPI003EE4BAF3
MTEPHRDNDRYSFSLKIALAALAITLLAIVLTTVVSAGLSFPSIDQGWATLIAGAIGFGAIAFQTDKGFENLRRSAVEQAEANREAREHQAYLQNRLELERELRNKKGLAGTLAAELTVLSGQVTNRLPLLGIQRKVYKDMVGTSKANVADLSHQIAAFEAPIFRQSVGQLALLGPSTAHDVVDIYTTLLTRPSGSTDTLTGEQIAMLFEAWEKIYATWLSDKEIVFKRLMAIVGDSPDPGALVDFRKKRLSKDVSKTVADGEI